MRKIKFLFWAACFCTAMASCKKDGDKLPDAPNPPGIDLSRDTIISTFGAEFFMEADLKDAVGLKSFTIRYDNWFLANTVSLADSSYPKNYHVKYKFRMPDTASNRPHRIAITATNVDGKETSSEYVVMVDTDYPKLYLTETKDAAKLANDLFGVPMLVDKLGPYQYKATYYSSAPNTNIWFVPSKTQLKPTLYGADPANAARLTADAAVAQPLILAAKGYYSIILNTLSLDYKIEQLPTPNPAGAFPQVALAGQGFYDYPNIMWQNAMPDIILLDKDATNPYLFTKIVKLGTPPGQNYTDASFIFTTNNGWTDFWRFDNATEPEYTVPNNGATGGNFKISATPVTYKVTFDTYLNRCKFEKQ